MIVLYNYDETFPESGDPRIRIHGHEPCLADTKPSLEQDCLR